MLDRMARQMPGDTHLRLHVMDGQAPDAQGPFDLICSSLAMQWFHNRAQALHALAGLLAPGDTWPWPRWPPAALHSGVPPMTVRAWPVPFRTTRRRPGCRRNGPSWARGCGRYRRLWTCLPHRWPSPANSGP
ncbi:hypothetical protein RAA17_17145 [Komagataeibacter rhaeticus]|nr:hypothetical protein [Komagataeibacter rhaeticus]